MRKRTIALTTREPSNETELFTGKISIEKTRAIWNDKKRIYNDNELIRIRDWMYSIAEVIILTVRKSRRQSTTISLNEHNNEAAQSYYLHPREYRRAG